MAFVNREFLRWARICCLISMTWAASAGLWPRAADARTGKVVLSVVGDERMSSDLKELSEDFQKQQPLSGDALIDRKFHHPTAPINGNTIPALDEAVMEQQPTNSVVITDLPIEEEPLECGAVGTRGNLYAWIKIRYDLQSVAHSLGRDSTTEGRSELVCPTL